MFFMCSNEKWLAAIGQWLSWELNGIAITYRLFDKMNRNRDVEKRWYFAYNRTRDFFKWAKWMEVSDVFVFFSLLYSNKMKTNPHLPIYLKIPPTTTTTTIRKKKIQSVTMVQPQVSNFTRTLNMDSVIWYKHCYCFEFSLKLSTAWIRMMYFSFTNSGFVYYIFCTRFPST